MIGPLVKEMTELG